MRQLLLGLWGLMVGFCNLQAEESVNMEKRQPIVVIETTLGAIEVTLFTDLAPKACENFLGLAGRNYYNGSPFHRVIPKFMIQGGDPTGKGTGGESIWGKDFEDEFSPTLTFNTPGLLAMANSGPNKNGSQFFITTAVTKWLDKKHTIFGKVTKGYEVVQAIEAKGSENGIPQGDKVKILKMTVKAE